jgi:NB-ARC domain
MPDLMFVGREDSLTEIKKLLGVGQEVQRGSNLTVVRGWPGVGKTTLVGVLARDPEIAKAFPDGVLWTALEQTPELMSALSAWGRVLGTDDLLRIPGIEEATEKLGLLLHDKRMLLIVDGILDVTHALPFLRAAANSRCALLATTRLTSVADALTEFHTSRSPDQSVYVLPVLTEEDALLLLSYLAPGVVEGHLDACRELVGDLECLPLALHVAGRLLNEEAKMGLDVIDLITGIRRDAKLLDEHAPLDRAEGVTIPTVDVLFRRSTDRLDIVTRECFAYLGAFAPKPATFDAAAMRAVWMVDDPKPIIRKLVGHGLLVPIGAGRFQIHALLVQHARSLFS